MSDNKTIAKNTVFLYFRMMFVMGVAIFSSRIVLNVLGNGDYGLYNVVGGFVLMLSFLNGAAGAATSRYLTYYLGKKDYVRYQQSFSAAFFIHIFIALVIAVFAETIGLWFLHNEMTIEPARMEAAEWVFHLSVLSCFVTFTQVPYTASIISHERMSVYAYIGITEALLKLVILYLLAYSPYDKLKTYAVLLFLVSTIIAVSYRLYCKFEIKECKITMVRDKAVFKELFKYAGWDTLGSITGIAQTQGINVVLNLFFSTVVNAARGIAYQVDAAVMTFISNFLTAVNPQIAKAYAVNDIDRMSKLLLYAGKYAFLMFSCLSVPIILEAPYILELWLKQYPPYTVIFLQLVLVNHFFSLINQIINTGVHATGDAKRLNIYAGTISILKLPLAYVLLLMGCGPEWVFVSLIPMTIICMGADMHVLLLNIKFDYKRFFRIVLFKNILLMVIPVLAAYWVTSIMEESFIRLITVVVVYCLLLMIEIYFWGMKKPEKEKFTNYINKKVCLILRKS